MAESVANGVESKLNLVRVDDVLPPQLQTAPDGASLSPGNRGGEPGVVGRRQCVGHVDECRPQCPAECHQGFALATEKRGRRAAAIPAMNIGAPLAGGQTMGPDDPRETLQEIPLRIAGSDAIHVVVWLDGGIGILLPLAHADRIRHRHRQQ